jgi:drug/metabolite transporter (DMT)-like permease
MFPLILSVLTSVSLFVVFRLFSKFQVNTFQAITVNYFVCVITGLLFIDKSNEIVFYPQNWWFMAIFLGLTFISTFYLMGIATQRVGVTVTTLANKMSMIIPVLFNLLIFKSTKEFDWLNGLGLVAAVGAIILSNYSTPKENNTENKTQNNTEKETQNKQTVEKGQSLRVNKILLPISIFFLGGVIDTSLSYTNLRLLQPNEEVIFPIALFAMAAFVGFLIVGYKVLFQKETFTLKSIIAGVILGIPNYFSIYFLLMALTAFDGNGAFVLPVMSIGIIVIASLVSVLLLKDKLNRINMLGIGVAILAIVLLSYQKINIL